MTGVLVVAGNGKALCSLYNGSALFGVALIGSLGLNAVLSSFVSSPSNSSASSNKFNDLCESKDWLYECCPCDAACGGGGRCKEEKSLSSTKVSVDKLSGLCDDLDSKGVDCEGDSKIVVSDAFELRDDNELLHVFCFNWCFLTADVVGLLMVAVAAFSLLVGNADSVKLDEVGVFDCCCWWCLNWVLDALLGNVNVIE